MTKSWSFTLYGQKIAPFPQISIVEDCNTPKTTLIQGGGGWNSVKQCLLLLFVTDCRYTHQFQVTIFPNTIATMHSILDNTIQHNNDGGNYRDQQLQRTFTKHTMYNVIQHKNWRKRCREMKNLTHKYCYRTY